MTLIEYLNNVLKSQTLAEGSKELKQLRAHRQDVEALLRMRFPIVRRRFVMAVRWQRRR
jgi:hypothetical protein